VKPTIYRICVRGHISERLAPAFEGMLLHAADGDTEITGEIRDQSQLYGLLDRVRDLGLDLISAYPTAAAPTDDSAH
jgi:hypothetical protein